MRRTLHRALLTGSLALILAACGGQAASTGGEDAPVVPTVTSVAPEPSIDVPVAPQTEAPSVVPEIPADDGSIQPEAAVPLCPYYEPSGAVVSAPCDPALIDPSRQLVPVEQGAPDQESATTITCETVCTSSGCEQYQYSVLNCP